MKKGAVRTGNNLLRPILIAVIVIALIVSVYFTFFNTSSCKTRVCFDKAIAKCSRVSFTDVQEQVTWSYLIKGSQKDKCVISVKIANSQLKEAKAIENKEMLCYLPRGIIAEPGSELDSCHGLLKEELQSIIIKKLHIYIVQNIGKISEEASKAF